MNKGSKYYSLFEYLRRCREDEVSPTLNEIEALMGARLPGSARTARAWWSNRDGRGTLQALAWIEAGYHVTEIDLDDARVTFCKISREYKVQWVNGVVVWNGDAVKALRFHMGLTQSQLAEELGVRQQTICEWETEAYAPSRAMSKYLSMVAERAGFKYGKEG